MWRTVMRATATVLTGLIVGVYAVFLSGTSRWLISSVRGTTAVVLILGVGAWVLYSLARNQSLSARDVGRTATVLSHVTLIAAVIGLITGSPVALAVLVVGATALWLLTTIRDASTVIRPKHPEETAPAPPLDKVGASEGPLKWVKRDGRVSGS
jgi:hypothetical protein